MTVEPTLDVDLSRAVAQQGAEHIVWLVRDATVENGQLAISGWALVTEGSPSDASFTVNGVPFASVSYGIASPDLAEHFFEVANSSACRFECSIPLSSVPQDRFLRFEFVQNANEARARTTAWWLPTEQSASSALSEERISRVVGSGDVFNFLMGGATIFHRIQDYLSAKFDTTYENLQAILDWGCGAGRLISQFDGVSGPQIWGVDIDHDNLAHCRQQFGFAHFDVVPLTPPTQFEEGFFDLTIGISVCTHLSRPNQRLWLAELRRISKPGALVLLSVQGMAQSALYREAPEMMRSLQENGFVVKGVNPRINEIIGEESYYIDVIQTHDDIRRNWGEHFEVLDFLPGLAANQDLVVLRVPT